MPQTPTWESCSDLYPLDWLFGPDTNISRLSDRADTLKSWIVLGRSSSWLWTSAMRSVSYIQHLFVFTATPQLDIARRISITGDSRRCRDDPYKRDYEMHAVKPTVIAWTPIRSVSCPLGRAVTHRLGSWMKLLFLPFFKQSYVLPLFRGLIVGCFAMYVPCDPVCEYPTEMHPAAIHSDRRWPLLAHCVV